jgi:hypothetical protein
MGAASPEYSGGRGGRAVLRVPPSALGVSSDPTVGMTIKHKRTINNPKVYESVPLFLFIAITSNFGRIQKADKKALTKKSKFYHAYGLQWGFSSFN